jgi:hypothetical protein
MTRRSSSHHDHPRRNREAQPFRPRRKPTDAAETWAESAFEAHEVDEWLLAG